jgi:hypothetical protein
MGYITTVLTSQERQKAGPKGGTQAAATVALDPVGSVWVAIDSAPQGQKVDRDTGAIYRPPKKSGASAHGWHRLWYLPIPCHLTYL